MIDLNKQNMKKIIGLIFFVLFGILAVENIEYLVNIIGFFFKIIGPFVLGVGMAFVLNVPMKFFERIFAKKVSKTRVNTKKNREKDKKYQKRLRIISMFLSFLILVILVWFVLVLVIPELINTFEIFKKNVPSMFNQAKEKLIELMDNYPDIVVKIQAIKPNWASLENTWNDFLKNGITNILSSSVGFVISAITSVFSFILAMIFSIYLLYQKEKLCVQVQKVIYAFIPKNKADYIVKIGKTSNEIFSNFIGGQLIEACILGGLCFIGMTILRIPYALTASVLIGFTALIPVFGAFIGTGIGALMIVVVSPIKALWFIIFIIVLQQIEGNIIYPKVVGNSVGLPAIWVMMAVIVGGSCFGVVGMLISVPLFSVIYTLFRETVNNRLKSKNWKWDE